nr:C10 family peptidase [Kiritimatiellia bacterium]
MHRKAVLTFACIAVLVSFIPTKAAEISLAQAKNATGKWLGRNQHPLNSNVGGKPVAGKTYTRSDGTPLFHVVRLSEGGFVVTSADDGIDPIIAVSGGEDLVADETNPLWILLNKDIENRLRTINLVRKQTAVNPLIARMNPVGSTAPEVQWTELLAESNFSTLGLSSVTDVRVSPLVQSTWDQSTAGNYSSWPITYNYYTPNNYVCGCVATAMSQLMRFHQFPEASMSPVERYYYTNSVKVIASTYGGLYSWADMPLMPTSAITEIQCQAIGKLTRDVGVSVCMNYTASSSGASTTHTSLALKDTFGYANAIGYIVDSFSDTLVQKAILSNLDGGYPVLLGIQGGGAGHAIVGDGYGYASTTLYVHLKWGMPLTPAATICSIHTMEEYPKTLRELNEKYGTEAACRK